MEELEYITDNALIMCDQGGSPAFFKSTFNKKVKIHSYLVTTAQDMEYKIKSLGMVFR